jgi:hypothetical protein
MSPDRGQVLMLTTATGFCQLDCGPRSFPSVTGEPQRRHGVVAQETLPAVPSELIVGEGRFMRADSDEARCVEMAGTLKRSHPEQAFSRKKSESCAFDYEVNAQIGGCSNRNSR